jgi:2,4-dienoyl-CoA reductase-like NADH-dependent reductase (Old Yellow Enzyme family)/NADPH-dependent 2,4-dienoyl-CoA reductase/sulfur reductase-like enzyme
MTTSQLSHLFSPLSIGKLRVPNRIVLPPMGNRYPTFAGTVTDRLIRYYLEMAQGGVGLIIVQFASVTASGRSSYYPLGIWDDDHIPGLQQLTQTIHAAGTPALIQLAHVGAMGSSAITGTQPIGPSSVPCFNREVPRELNVAELHGLVEAFAQAARRAVEAGFDGVELHMAHGYLLQQFLSPLSNHRRDEYGGDLKARLRFPLEVLRAVRAEVGEEIPIFCRLCVDEAVPGGILPEDGQKIAHALEQAGADVIDVTGGNAETFEVSVPSQADPPGGHLLPLAAAVKQVVSVPVIAVGKLHDPLVMERVLAEGQADLIAVGRGLIADPELPRKASEGRFREIRPCLACNAPECHGRIFRQLSMGCVVNPVVGRESSYELRPAERRRRVLVIGGGPAGLEAARVAALRGHQVVLCEKEARLGGQFFLAGQAPHKGAHLALINYYAHQLARLKVDVRLETALNVAGTLAVQPDAVVVATGARPLVSQLPGFGEDPLTAWDVLGGTPVGHSVAIVGGGSVACDTAEYLAARNHRVTILEMLPEIAQDMVFWTRRLTIKRLMAQDVEILLQCKVLERDGARLVYDRNGVQEVLDGVDHVLLAIGAVRHDPLSADLRAAGLTPLPIGDCVAPANAAVAIRQGYQAGLSV